MKDLYLVFKNLTRNKLRLTLNTFAIFIAFFLFGALGSLKTAFDAGIELSADDRLVVVNKINFTQPLPYAYINKVRGADGVSHATHFNWFGTYHQDQRRPLVGMAVDALSYFDVYSELELDEAAKQSWYKNRQGMIVGQSLANAKGWKVGDLIPISSNIFSKADGSTTWDMEVSGIFTGGAEQADTNYLLFHYEYYNETVSFGRDIIGWIALTTEDSSLNEKVAKSLDEQFANSAYETETSTEKQFNKAFIAQIGDIGFIITSVVLAAFFTILLIVGNAMALAIRERTGEIAVLKTLGFSAKRIFGMVLTESIMLSALGGVIGLGVAKLMLVASKAQLQGVLPNLILSQSVIVQAFIYMLALGLVTGFFPAYRAMRLNTIDALNRG